jgi:uncharacterized protein (TIGR00661 family)
MTQALALAKCLRDAGHEVVGAWVGRSPEWETPSFFVDELDAPVSFFTGPTLSTDRARRRVSAGRTAAQAVLSLPRYTASWARLALALSPRRVDVVVSFYELLSSFVRALVPKGAPRVAIGHQYLCDHPAADLDFGGRGQAALRVLTHTTAWGCRARLALSFRAFEPAPDPRLKVVPPILRERLFRAEPSAGTTLLAYLLTRGSTEELVDWQRSRPDVPLRCYLSGGASALSERPGAGCEILDLDGEAFLSDLASCRAFVTSSGFESLCEAHYLGKPILTLPTPGHPEQAMNARDAVHAGVARTGTLADLDAFWDEPSMPCEERVLAFRAWVSEGGARAVAEIERAAR